MRERKRGGGGIAHFQKFMQKHEKEHTGSGRLA